MAEMADPFDEALAGLRQIIVDIDGDGRPDVVTTADALQRMNRPSTALPSYLQGQINDVQNRQGLFTDENTAGPGRAVMAGLGDAIGFAGEMTGVPSMVRGARNIRQGVSEGSGMRTAAGVGEAAIGALPMAAAARPVANALFASAPRAMATLGVPMAATLPLQMSEAQAASGAKADTAVSADAEVQRLRQELNSLNQRRLGIQTTNIKGQSAASADASRARMDTAIGDQIRMTQEALTQAESRARESYTQSAPFREKYPEAVPAIMAAGGTLAFGMPFAGTMKNRLADASRSYRLGREADDIVRQANLTGPEAIPVAELATRQARLEQSSNALSRASSGVVPATTNALAQAGSVGMSGLTMAEASALPEQLDYMLNPPGHPARETASKLFRDPGYYQDRAAPFVGGMGLGLMGKKTANMLAPGGGVDQARIDAALELGTPQMLDRMGRLSQHREWMRTPPGPAGPALPGPSGGLQALPGGGAAGGGGGTPQIPGPRQMPSPGSAHYDQAGAHGAVARQYLDELLTANQRSRHSLANNPNLVETVARNLEARFHVAGLPPVRPEALRELTGASVAALRRMDATARAGGRGTVTAPALRDSVMTNIQGNPGMLSLPIAAGMSGEVFNALAPRPDSAY